jgi:catechol 2,3-dioxygenase
MYQTKIGHAHLKVRDLTRSIEFYTKFFNLRVVEQVGDHYAFLTGCGMHHEIALQNVGSSAPQPHPYATGLYHVAFEVPDRASLAEAYKALTAANIQVALVDHLISWAMYFDDPDGNGLEIYWDTRNEACGKQLWHGRNIHLTPEKLMAGICLPDEEHAG